MVGFRLSIVLLQAEIVLENPTAVPTVEMVVFVMGLELGITRVVLVAVLAVMMSTTLDPVFFQPSPSAEVDLTFVTDVMEGRVCLMLFEGVATVKITVTAFAVVGHCI